MYNTTNTWTKLHSQVLKSFIDALNNQGTNYFLLRNYEGLPDVNIGKDVDVVIAPGSYSKVAEILIQVLKSFDIHYYTTSRFDRMVCWYIMDNKRDFGLHLDLIENESYKGFEFFDFGELYSHTEKYNGMVVMRKDYDVFLLIIQNLIAYKYLKNKYRCKITEYYPLYRQEITQLAYKVFGKKVGSRFISLLDFYDYDKMEKEVNYYQNAFMKMTFCKHPILTMRNVVHFFADRFYRIIVCPQKYQRMIAFEAPDGTGKSTFIDNLTQRLSFLYNCDSTRFAVHHFRPSILPNLGAAGEKVGVMKQDKDFTNPHRAKPSGFVMSFVRMVYYWLDYAVGVPVLLRKEIHYERYSIYDRYIYDFLVDPLRTRINLPYSLRLLFAKLVKQPQIIFVLNAEPETIYTRKQELTLEEIQQQLSLFSKIKDSFKNAVEIDANKTPDEMITQAMDIIFNRFFQYVE